MHAASSNPEIATQLEPGFILDRYELLARVAEGGFGQVWLARLRGKRGFEKLVAIKVPRLTGDVHFQEMLLDEARIASAIDHDNVAKILELGEQGEILYIVMEWIDGEPLSTLLRVLEKQKVKFPLPLALRIVSDLCCAAHAAHELRGPDGQELGVVHRDISPQNVLIPSSGSVKLIDFGIAKARDRASGDTTDGTLKGKVKYMAPEQAFSGQVDRRSDVFALGAVLYRLLAGNAPYEAENEIATLHKLGRGLKPDPLPDTVPIVVREVVYRALEHSPDDRFKTAHDMHDALTTAMAASGNSAEPPDVAAFAETHLKDRSAKRRAAIEVALRAATDRTVSSKANFPPPLSSTQSGTSASIEMSGISSGPQSQSHPSHSQSRSVAQTTLDHARPAEPFPVIPQRNVRWLWGAALLIGAIGVLLIVLVMTSRKPAASSSSKPGTSVAAIAPPPAPSSPPPPIGSSEPPPAPSTTASSPSSSSSSSSSSTAATSKPPHPSATAAGRPVVIPKKPKPGPTAPDFGY